jgi:hypothetical protein
MGDILISCLLIVHPLSEEANSVYDVSNGSVFQVAAKVNGVTYVSPNATTGARSAASLNRSQYGYTQFLFSMAIGVFLFWGLLSDTISCR